MLDEVGRVGNDRRCLENQTYAVGEEGSRQDLQGGDASGAFVAAPMVSSRAPFSQSLKFRAGQDQSTADGIVTH